VRELSDITLGQTFDEIMEEMQSNAQEQYGQDFRISENSDWYRENAPVGLAIKRLYDKLQNSIDNSRLRTAGDPYFFGGAANFMFFRKMPSYASGILETSDTQEGSTAEIGEIQVRKANTDITYSNTEAVTATGNTFQVNFQCDSTGEDGNADEGTITELVSAPSGWGSFSNPSTFEGGQDLEELETSRKRYFNGGFSKSYWNEDGIYAALMEISGVESAKVVVNNEDEAVGDQPRRSVYCIVDGGLDADIAEVLFEKVDQAVYMYGSTSVTLQNSQGDDRTVYFDRPTEVTIDKKLTVIGDGTTEDIETAVDEYIESVKVGGVISSHYAGEYIADNVSSAANFDHIGVTFKKYGTTEFVSAISLSDNEKPVAGEVE